MTEDQIVKRSIRKKGVASTRTSKRQVGDAAEEIVITGDAKSKDTMTLIKGGWGGRIVKKCFIIIVRCDIK